MSSDLGSATLYLCDPKVPIQGITSLTWEVPRGPSVMGAQHGVLIRAGYLGSCVYDTSQLFLLSFPALKTAKMLLPPNQFPSQLSQV
jgi:hypothetical protein